MSRRNGNAGSQTLRDCYEQIAQRHGIEPAQVRTACRALRRVEEEGGDLEVRWYAYRGVAQAKESRPRPFGET